MFEKRKGKQSLKEQKDIFQQCKELPRFVNYTFWYGNGTRKGMPAKKKKQTGSAVRTKANRNQKRNLKGSIQTEGY